MVPPQRSSHQSVIGRLATQMIKQSAPSGESSDEGISSQDDLRKKKRKDSKILPHQLHSIPLRSSEFLIMTRHGESSTEERLKACVYHRRWITRTKKLNKTHKFRDWFVLHYNFPLLCSLFLLSRPLLKPYPPWFYHISVIPFPFVLLLSPWRCARTPEKF